MINAPTKEQLSMLPCLYATESTHPEEKIVQLHFTVNNCHWWAIEWDGTDTFFGFVLLNGWEESSEFGYFTLSGLDTLKSYGEIEVLNDPFWRPQPVKDVWLIRRVLQDRQRKFVNNG